MPKQNTPMSEKANSYALMMLLALYLAQGLPVGFMTQALPALLRHYGVSLTQIGFSGLLMLPWAIKFLWAPAIDRFGYQKMGHYRFWIILTQALTIVCLFILAYLPVEQLHQLSALWYLCIVLLLMNTLCATQDIATDGLAVNILKKGQVHWGNTFQVMGSRLGFLLGGGAVLYSIDILSWKTTFIALAIGVMLNSLPILFYREPQFKIVPQATFVKKNNILLKIKNIYGHLWHSNELKLWLLVLVTYKIADGLSGPIIKPMMIDMGLSLAQIGLYVTMFGAVCALFGAWLAAWLIKRFSLAVMLIWFSILQSMAILYYLILAYLFEQQIGFSLFHVYAANAVEEFFAAMRLVAMLSLIMLYAREKFAGTDFTVQVSIMTLVSGGLYVVGGKLADSMGYTTFLSLIFVLSMLCILPKLYWFYMKKSV
jgi:MFS family permease